MTFKSTLNLSNLFTSLLPSSAPAKVEANAVVGPAAQPVLQGAESQFHQPGVVRPDAQHRIVLQPHDGERHYFAKDIYAANAMSVQFMNPSKPTEVAAAEGGTVGSIPGVTDNGAFGGNILELRVGETVTETIDGSKVSEPVVMHKHGLRPENVTEDKVTPGAAATDSDMLPLFGVGPAAGENEPGVGGRKDATVTWKVGGKARTRADHSHTHGFELGLVADQVRRGLIHPIIIRDKTSDALERAGLPHTLGQDDLVMVLQDETVKPGTKKVRMGIEDGTDQDGKLGSKVSVNGTFSPVFDVKSGLMRLRVQNFSTARQMKLAFDNGQDFYVVAGQQGFLSSPRKINGTQGVVLAPSEGAEIVWQPDPTKTKNGSVSLISRAFLPDGELFTPKEPTERSDEDRQAEREGRPVQGAEMHVMRFNVPANLAKPDKDLEALFGSHGTLTSLQKKLAALPSRSIKAVDSDIKHHRIKVRSFQLEGAPLSERAEEVFDGLLAAKDHYGREDAGDNTAGFDELVQKKLLTPVEGKAGRYALEDEISVGSDLSPKAKALFDTLFMKPVLVTEAELGGDAAALAELKAAGNVVKSEAHPGQYEVRDLARTINGKLFDLRRMDGDIKVGTKEVWSIDNPSDMPHPFHIHGREFRIVDVTNADGSPADTSQLYRSDKPGEAGEMADTINLAPGQRARVEVDFRGAKPGSMLMVHCHNLDHEDGVEGHGMMQMFNFVP